MVTPNCRVGTEHTSWYIKGAELTSKRTKDAGGIGQQEPMKFNPSKCQVSPQGGKSTCDNTSWGERGWGVALHEGLWSGSGQWVEHEPLACHSSKGARYVLSYMNSGTVCRWKERITTLCVALISPHPDATSSCGLQHRKAMANMSNLKWGPLRC